MPAPTASRADPAALFARSGLAGARLPRPPRSTLSFPACMCFMWSWPRLLLTRHLCALPAVLAQSEDEAVSSEGEGAE